MTCLDDDRRDCSGGIYSRVENSTSQRDDVSYKYRIGGKQAPQYFEVSHSFEIRDALNETDQSNN